MKYHLLYILKNKLNTPKKNRFYACAHLALILLICFSTPSFATETAAPIDAIVGKLKIRQPNWHLRTIDKYPDGTPRLIIYYEPILGKNYEIPVKQALLAENGKVVEETDLQVLAIP